MTSALDFGTLRSLLQTKTQENFQTLIDLFQRSNAPKEEQTQWIDYATESLISWPNELRLYYPKEHTFFEHLSSPCVSLIRGLSNYYSQRAPLSFLYDLTHHPNLHNLSSLTLKRIELDDTKINSLFNESSHLGLEHLNLADNFGMRGPNHKKLAKSLQMTHLKSLHLANMHLGATGIKALMNNPLLHQLTSLDLSYNPLGSGAMKTLGNAPLTTLQNLNLYAGSGQAKIKDKGCQALCVSPHLNSLKTLNLHGQWIGDEGAQMLAQSTLCTSLEHLDLSYNQLSGVGLEALLCSPTLRHLTHLTLNSNFHQNFTSGENFIHTEALNNLTHLNLTHCNITDDILTDLIQAPWFPQLQHLHIYNNPITDKGAKLLADTPLTQIKSFNINNTYITREGSETLRKTHPKAKCAGGYR